MPTRNHRTRNFFFSAVAGLALCAAAIPAAAQRSQQPIVPTPGDPRMIDATAALPEIGELLPQFEAELLPGEPINADSLVGFAHIVAIWSTDCPGSRQALRGLQTLHDTLAPRGLRVLVLATDTSRSALQHFLKEHNVQFPVAQITSNQIRAFVRSRRVGPNEPYQVVFAKPSFLFANEDGVILARDGGGLRDEFLNEVRRAFSGSLDQ